MREITAPIRKYFKTGETRSVKFRIKQLKALKKALLQYDEKIIEALHDDLNNSSFEAVMTETGLVQE